MYKVIHIPERCKYNSFIDKTIDIQRKAGINIITPGICFDGYEGSSYSLLDLLTMVDRKEDLIMHFHWPEKLLQGADIRQILIDLEKIRSMRKVHILKTIHNKKPHENSSYKDKLDAYINRNAEAYIVFSDKQKREQLCYEKHIPIKIVPHPNYTLGDISYYIEESHLWRFLIPGRIRTYKNYHLLMETLSNIENDNISFHVVGKPDNIEIVNELMLLSKKDRRLTCSFEFLAEEDFIREFFEYDAVILPYPEIWSSGVVIMAANVRCPLICKLPKMIDGLTSEMGVFDNADTLLDTCTLRRLIDDAIHIGKTELRNRANQLYNLISCNSDEKIGTLYALIYNEIAGGQL